MILCVKHVDIEGPGTIGEFFEKTDFDFKIIELSEGQRLPSHLDDIDAVVVLGGPMNVYEEDKYPFLKEDDIFLKKVLKKEIPLLGICLGSQLIAKACGAEVQKSEIKEIGWSVVELTEEGKDDPLFAGLGNLLAVFQWHHDTFDIPKEGYLLSRSRVCENQAFRTDKYVYGLQFHLEVTEDIIASWIRKYFKVDEASGHPEGKKMMEQYKQLRDQFDQQAEKIYSNFVTIINERKSVVV